MNSADQPRKHFVYRTTSGQVLLESDANLLPPDTGAVIRLPSLSTPEEFISYRVQEVHFAPESQEKVTIYIELEPLRP